MIMIDFNIIIVMEIIAIMITETTSMVTNMKIVVRGPKHGNEQVQNKTMSITMNKAPWYRESLLAQ